MTTVRELDGIPGLTGLYAKALAGFTVAPALGLVPGAPGRGEQLPDVELRAPATADREHVAAYDRVCGFRLSDTLPPTYVHLLAFPLAMELMTARSFPFGVMGLVHVRNEISQLRPVATQEPLVVSVRAENLRPHDRGRQFDVAAEAAVAGEPVWRGRSTYLHREGRGGGGGGATRAAEERGTPAAKARWQVPGDVGRRYAGVSGDRNPIHLHPLSARLFGMPRPIAHGMWLKARCLATLEGTLPAAYAVDVRFKLPLYLPARVAFAEWPEDGGRAFAVHAARDGKPHLTGSVLRPATG